MSEKNKNEPKSPKCEIEKWPKTWKQMRPFGGLK